MKPFRYERAQDAASAVALVSQAAHAGYLAGGTNLVDHLKLGVSRKVSFPCSGLASRGFGTDSQSGDDWRKSLTADTLRLLSGCHQALQ